MKFGSIFNLTLYLSGEKELLSWKHSLWKFSGRQDWWETDGGEAHRSRACQRLQQASSRSPC